MTRRPRIAGPGFVTSTDKGWIEYIPWSVVVDDETLVAALARFQRGITQEGWDTGETPGYDDPRPT